MLKNEMKMNNAINMKVPISRQACKYDGIAESNMEQANFSYGCNAIYYNSYNPGIISL
jgi:hypothetical protein